MIDVHVAKAVPGFALDAAFRNESGLTALFGRSGSGKSMTLGLIAGLVRPDRGYVQLAGRRLVDMPSIYVPMHKRRIGLVAQDSHLFPHLSVRQNLLFGRWFAPKADRVVALDAVVDTLGIGHLMSRRTAGLSGGERQRVAFGRAVLAAPRLLLFDEPLAALDRERKLEILPLIERLRDQFGVPIIYVSHALEEVARLAAHVVILDRGRVTAQGDPTIVFGRTPELAEPRFGRISVLNVTVGARDEPYGLTALEHPAGTLWLAGPAGPPGRRTRALIHATDVALATGATGTLSIRSALAGTIVGLEQEGPRAAVEVALSGGGSIVAIITRRALDDLSLAIGTPVRALIKTVALNEGAIAR